MSELSEEEIARAPVYDGSIEVRLDDKGGVDEIVGFGVICHIERLSNGTWFVNLTRPDQTGEAFWLAGKGSVEVCHTEHRTAPTAGPNAAPWTLADALLQPALERARVALTDEQDHLLMCAIENLRSAERNDRTVEAAWRMAEKMEAWRKAAAIRKG